MDQKFKIDPIKIDSSDCVVHVGQRIADGKIVELGKPHRFHEGEWVKIIPTITMKESLAITQVTSMADKQEGEMLKTFEQICESLANRVVDWDWTGIDGEDLPKPYKNPVAFHELTNEEFIWLITASLGESLADKKKELNISQTTHSTSTQNSQAKE